MAFLFHSQYFDPEVWRSAIHSVDPSVDFRTLHQMGDPAEIECLMAWRPPPGTFSRLSNLKLIYSTGAGVDGLLSDPERPKGIPVARVFDSQLVRDMINFVIGAVLRHHLRFDFYQHQQLTEAWHIAPTCQQHLDAWELWGWEDWAVLLRKIWRDWGSKLLDGRGSGGWIFKK